MSSVKFVRIILVTAVVLLVSGHNLVVAQEGGLTKIQKKKSKEKAKEHLPDSWVNPAPDQDADFTIHPFVPSKWGTGYLFDCLTTDGRIRAFNRGDSGSGHGWSGANTMVWNANAKGVTVFDPETTGENNFAIGFTGEYAKEDFDPMGLWYANTRAGYWGTPLEGKYFGFALMGNGYIESPDKPVEPASLFIQQLIDRIGKKQAMRALQ